MSQIWNHFTLISPKPEIGMGATVFSYTDRSAATIVKISPSGKTAWIVYDKAERTDKNGMSESQDYAYSPGEGKPIRCSLRKNGEWRMSGSDQRKVAFGKRESYHDYSF